MALNRMRGTHAIRLNRHLHKVCAAPEARAKWPAHVRDLPERMHQLAGDDHHILLCSHSNCTRHMYLICQRYVCDLPERLHQLAGGAHRVLPWSYFSCAPLSLTGLHNAGKTPLVIISATGKKKKKPPPCPAITRPGQHTLCLCLLAGELSRSQAVPSCQAHSSPQAADS